jgi:hypothetical protein
VEEHGCGALRGIGHYSQRVSIVLLKTNLLEVRPRIFSVGSVPNDLSMNGARHAVLQLEVHLGNCVFWEHGSIRDITCEEESAKILPQIFFPRPKESFWSLLQALCPRTNSGRLDHVADGKSLYRLVLGSATRAVAASDRLDMAATLFQVRYIDMNEDVEIAFLLVSTVGGALLNHLDRFCDLGSATSPVSHTISVANLLTVVVGGLVFW